MKVLCFIFLAALPLSMAQCYCGPPPCIGIPEVDVRSVLSSFFIETDISPFIGM